MDTILQLQRIGGNRAVERLLAGRGVQARLTVGPGDDAYEREADRVAGAVAHGSARGSRENGQGAGAPASGTIAATVTPLAQRHTPDAKPGDREVDPEELQEAAMQRKSAGGADAGFEAGGAVESALDRGAGQGRPLDDPVRADMEARIGTGFGGVRIHDDGDAAQLNRAVSANAFTRGQDIYFGAGQYAPESDRGRFLLAHELTHVVQQGGGRGPVPVQRANIPRGQPLPDLNNTIGERIGATLNQDPSFVVSAERHQLRTLERVLADNATLRAALGPGAAAVSDAAIGDVRAAFAGVVPTARRTLGRQAFALQAGRPAGEVGKTFETLEYDAKAALKATFKGPDLASRLMIANNLRSATGDVAAAARGQFQETRGDVALEPAYLPDALRAGFTAVLKQLSVVQSLTGQGPTAGGGQPSGGARPQKPEWRDPGKLVDKVVVKHSKGIPDWLSKRREQKSQGKFKAKVEQVDQWLRTLLEPAMLRRVTRPQIVMHTRGQMKVLGSAKRFFFLPDPTGFRPNYGEGKVNLSFDEGYPLIAHEMGHAIEEFLPIKAWHDMNLLLERRHEEKAGTNRAARKGATLWTAGLINAGPLTDEGRYAGKYVTGKYTSTAYDDAGNAEVFSQALEFFSKPSDALKLIDGDPQHAAIVLRSIRPQEYAALAALRPFDKYLPRSQSGR